MGTVSSTTSNNYFLNSRKDHILFSLRIFSSLFGQGESRGYKKEMGSQYWGCNCEKLNLWPLGDICIWVSHPLVCSKQSPCNNNLLACKSIGPCNDFDNQWNATLLQFSLQLHRLTMTLWVLSRDVPCLSVCQTVCLIPSPLPAAFSLHHSSESHWNRTPVPFLIETPL